MPIKVYTATITSGTSSCNSPTMPVGNYICSVVVPTMSTAVQMMLFASADEGSNYYQVYSVVPNTSTVAINSFCIAAGIGTSGGIVQVPPGHRNIQLRGTAVVDGGVIFKIISMDNN